MYIGDIMEEMEYIGTIILATGLTPEAIEQMDKAEFWDLEEYELRRAPGTCCPEPSCDYGRCEVCKMCGADCSKCQRRSGHE